MGESTNLGHRLSSGFK